MFFAGFRNVEEKSSHRVNRINQQFASSLVTKHSHPGLELLMCHLLLCHWPFCLLDRKMDFLNDKIPDTEIVCVLSMIMCWGRFLWPNNQKVRIYSVWLVTTTPLQFGRRLTHLVFTLIHNRSLEDGYGRTKAAG